VFDDVAKALEFDEKGFRDVVGNIDGLKDQLPESMQKCLAFFPGVDRKQTGYEGLMAAQECLPNNDVRDAFAAELSRVAWHRYPDRAATELRAEIAAMHGVAPDQVFVANGSSPILAAFGEMIAMKGKGQLVTSLATYEGVPRAAAEYGADVIMTPLTADYTMVNAFSARAASQIAALAVPCRASNAVA
jgi:histidinol-phosphate/aromatic aminotransferase/cobyric acid decarboxylase-like protein